MLAVEVTDGARTMADCCFAFALVDSEGALDLTCAKLSVRCVLSVGLVEDIVVVIAVGGRSISVESGCGCSSGMRGDNREAESESRRKNPARFNFNLSPPPFMSLHQLWGTNAILRPQYAI